MTIVNMVNQAKNYKLLAILAELRVYDIIEEANTIRDFSYYISKNFLLSRI